MVLLPWLHSINFYSNISAMPALLRKSKLVVDEAYVNIRTNEIYDIITEFPDSSTAVFEMREPLARTESHHTFAISFHKDN